MDELVKGDRGSSPVGGAGYLAVVLFWRFRSALQLRRASDRAAALAARGHLARSGGRRQSRSGGRARAGRTARRCRRSPSSKSISPARGPASRCATRVGATWRVKWGDEVQVETLATRLAWAAGYFVEITYFVAEGTHRRRNRPSSALAAASTPTAASRLRASSSTKRTSSSTSTSTAGRGTTIPFVGTRELNGLKIVMMWLSNWDAKDVRDVARGSNTAIFEYRDAGRRSRGALSDHRLGRRARPLGQRRQSRTMGLLKGLPRRRRSSSRASTASFVRWGYTGQRTADIARASA